ncbi:hypothetical protein PLESTB_001767700 [Pleodorina starrii]|uniref:Uncharacterized protein n=1 Tax=Pleodorina starrii TaxID=330485 RepID=A0A9W6BZP2_9CHLO|nr:hypothetical protein PLESTM_001862900 [Pleodorina starrii]GLC61541.1 hypothetical protein PLESTB_001767700 [Pleodorina starrii]GLC76819.1 hypothetical protein PLESTF_001844500 [Pleodorina starrii]
MGTEFMKQHEQKLAALNADFEAKLKEQETEVQSWQEHAAQTTNALSDLIRDKEALETANRQLEAANRALLADFSRLQQQFDEQEVALADRTQQWEAACKRTAVLEPLQQQVSELSRQAAEAEALRQQVVGLEAQMAADVEPLRKRAAEAEALQRQLAVAERQAAAVGPLEAQLKEAQSNYVTAAKDLEIWIRKHGSLLVQKAEAEEQRDRLFDPRLDLAEVRGAMPAVDAAMQALESELAGVAVRMDAVHASYAESIQWTRDKVTQRLERMAAKIRERDEQIDQLQAQLREGVQAAEAEAEAEAVAAP